MGVVHLVNTHHNTVQSEESTIATMFSSKAVILFLSVIQLIACLGLLVESCEEAQKVDHLKLAMTWQPGACKSGKVKCKGWNSVFSIHGLWPQANKGRLEFCCTKEFYLSKKVETIKKSLRANWPTITPGREDSAWEYQFNKHGSCAIGKVAGAKNIVDYFSKAIDEFKRFDLEKVLQAGGYRIKTPNVYFGSDILQFLRGHFGHQFQLTCESMGRSKAVVEIRACYDTNMKQIDCNNSKIGCMGPLTFQ